MKFCTKCRLEKPFTEFSKNKSIKDGHRSACKLCDKAKDASRYLENSEKIKAYSRQYREANREKVKESEEIRRIKNKERIKESQRAYRERNKEKIREKRLARYEENKERERQRVARYRSENPEKITDYRLRTLEEKRKTGLAFRKANKKRISERSAKYYEENSRLINQRNAEWRRLNPEKARALNANRRSRERSAEGRHKGDDIIAILSLQQGLCANCKTKLLKSGANNYHVDHIIPLSRGGSNWPSNLQCLCAACNLSKHAKDPIDWAREQGRLI